MDEYTYTISKDDVLVFANEYFDCQFNIADAENILVELYENSSIKVAIERCLYDCVRDYIGNVSINTDR